MNSTTVRLIIASLILLSTSCTTTREEKGVLTGAADEPGTGMQENLDEAARQRLDRWCGLVASGRNWPDRIRLEKVNDLINEARFVPDEPQWGQSDYWATPYELLVANRGDCEDFTIAKYYTLTEMGMPDNRLRITYVKSIKLNQAHMVLGYYSRPGVPPLVLDNLNEKILPATLRPDLLPVYSFNGTGLWIAKTRGDDRLVGNADRLNAWNELRVRMNGNASNARTHRVVDTRLIDYCRRPR